MKIVIDQLIDPADWIFSGDGTAEFQEWPHLAASHLPGALLFTFNEPCTASLDLAAPAPLLDQHGNRLHSFQFYQHSYYTGPNSAKIRFIDRAGSPTPPWPTLEYWLMPDVYPQFENGLDQVDRIEIEALGPVQFWASELIAFVDELPIDIYRALQAVIEYERDRLPSIRCGTVTASAGDTELQIGETGRQFLDQRTPIRIGSEKHVIENWTDEGKALLSKQGLDGETLASDYTNEPVYLFLPVNTEPGADKFMLPSINLSGGWSYSLMETRRPVADSWDPRDDTIRVRNGRKRRLHDSLAIDPQARQGEPLELMNRILDTAVTPGRTIWINGTGCEITVLPTTEEEGGDPTIPIGKTRTIVQAEVEPDMETGARTSATKGLILEQEIRRPDS
jgi:hypothetical protein